MRNPGNRRPCVLDANRDGVIASYRGDSRERPAPKLPRGPLTVMQARAVALPAVDHGETAIRQVGRRKPMDRKARIRERQRPLNTAERVRGLHLRFRPALSWVTGP